MIHTKLFPTITIIWLCCQSKLAWSLDLSVGLAGISESDDRLRPGVTLALATERLHNSLHYFGLKSDFYREDAYLLGSGALFGFPGIKNVMAYAGGSLQIKELTYQEQLDSNEPVSESRQSTNLGLYLGMHYSIVPGVLKIGWESHLYPAGLAGILLATGRTESIYINIGYTL